MQSSLEAICTFMLTLGDRQHWDNQAEQHVETAHIRAYRVLVCVIAEVLSSS